MLTANHLPITGSVNESAIGSTTPVVTNVTLDFQHDTINSFPNLTGTNLQITGGIGIAVVNHDVGVNVLQGPDAPAGGGATPMFITATAGTTFTLNSVLIGTFGSGPNPLTLLAFDASGHQIGSATFNPTTLGFVSQEPSASFTAFSNLQISQLEIEPPASGFNGRIVIDNLNVTETTTPVAHPAETVLDLTPLVSVGADAPGTWSLSSFSSAQNAGSLTYHGTQITMTSDGHTITGVAGGTTIFTMALSTDGHATFDLFHQIDGGTLRSIDFSQFVTVTDDDGDSVHLSTGEFVINVNSPIDLTPSVAATTVLVDESGLPVHNGLPAGSTFGDGSNVHSGQVAINLGDTPSTVSIGNIVLAAGEDFAGQFGTLHINSVSSTAVNYTYTLTTNSSGNSTADVFQITVTDDDGESQTNPLTIDIKNDVPAAEGRYGRVAGIRRLGERQRRDQRCRRRRRHRVDQLGGREQRHDRQRIGHADGSRRRILHLCRQAQRIRHRYVQLYDHRRRWRSVFVDAGHQHRQRPASAGCRDRTRQ